MSLRKKISELTSAGSLTGAELLEIVQSGSSFKVLLSTLKTFVITGYAKLVGPQTLEQTRVKPRVYKNTFDATLTVDLDSYDFFDQTAMSAGITVSNPTGTPYNGQLITFRFKDNGSSRSITWGAKYKDGGAGLQTATTINKYTFMTFVYNETADLYHTIIQLN